MAIHIFCNKCKTSNGLDADECSKCGAAFGRSKKYRVSVSVKGKRATRVVDNMTLARDVESALKGDLVRDEFDIADHRVKEVLTLNQLWKEHYLPWTRDHKKSWKDDECNYNRHLGPRFGSKPLEEIGSLDVERMKAQLRKSFRSSDIERMKKEQEKKPDEQVEKRKKKTRAPEKLLSAQTIKHQLALLRRLFNLARKWGLYDGANPVLAVQMPKIDNQKTEYLSDDQLKSLLNTLEGWPCLDSAAFVKFALFTGFRRGELLKLEWTDVDFNRGMVTLRDPKGGKSQTIPVSNEAIVVLKALTPCSQFVFPGENGKQRYDFKGPWLRIRKAAGLPADFRLHGLRHHFASALVSNGVDLAIVKELLSHKEMTTTQRYAHLRPDAIKQAALKSGQLLNPSTEREKVRGIRE